jgi:DNA-dependent RNA polymerase auxiliary subunit epsilon
MVDKNINININFRVLIIQFIDFLLGAHLFYEKNEYALII